MNLKKSFIKEISKLGRSMLIPILAMPIAGLLARLGAEDMLNIPILQVGAEVVLSNMDLLFVFGAIKAYAETKDVTCPFIAGIFTLYTFKETLFILSPETKMGVFAGILVGVIVSLVFNKSKEWKLPEILMFFGGEKLIITLGPLIALPLAYSMSKIWPFFQNGLDLFAKFLGTSGALGIFLFGFFNRLLIPVGLHHVLNSYVYFELGSFTNKSGDIIRGEIPRFLAGDPASGSFLTMFYIIMLFGMPGAALGLYKAAKQRDEIKGLYSSSALTSFFTGITEPLEFSFLFVAPILYFIHAIYTGLAGSLAYIFKIKLGGSGFSFMDLILNWNRGENQIGLLILCITFFFLYAITFYFVVEKFDFKTPGRDMGENKKFEDESFYELGHSNYSYMAKKILQNMGGKENIITVSNCVSRLRFEIKDITLIDDAKIKQTGVKGIIKLGENNVQIIIGGQVEKVRKELDEFLLQM